MMRRTATPHPTHEVYGRQVDPSASWTQPTQDLPYWMSYSTTVIPNPTYGGSSLITVEIVNLPLTYYGPSIPLGTDGNWVYGGLTSPAPSPPSTSIEPISTPAPTQTPTAVPTTSLEASSVVSTPSLPSSSLPPSLSQSSSFSAASFPPSSSVTWSSTASLASSTSTEAPPPVTNQAGGGLSSGAIIAASISGFVGLCVIIAGIIYCLYGKKDDPRLHQRTPSQDEEIRIGQNPEVASLISNRLLADDEQRPSSPTSVRSFGPAMRPRTPLSTRRFGQSPSYTHIPGVSGSATALSPGRSSPSRYARPSTPPLGDDEEEDAEEARDRIASLGSNMVEIGSPLPARPGLSFASQQGTELAMPPQSHAAEGPPPVVITAATPSTPSSKQRWSSILGPLRALAPSPTSPRRNSRQPGTSIAGISIPFFSVRRTSRNGDTVSLGSGWEEVNTPDMSNAGLHGLHFPAPPSHQEWSTTPPTPFPPASLATSSARASAADASAILPTVSSNGAGSRAYSYYSVSQLAPPQELGGPLPPLPGSPGERPKSTVSSGQTVYVDASSRPATPPALPALQQPQDIFTPGVNTSQRQMSQMPGSGVGLVSRPSGGIRLVSPMSATSGSSLGAGAYAVPMPPPRRPTLPEDPAAALYSSFDTAMEDEERARLTARRDVERAHAQQAADILDSPIPSSGLFPPPGLYSRKAESTDDEDFADSLRIRPLIIRKIASNGTKKQTPVGFGAAGPSRSPTSDILDDEPPMAQLRSRSASEESSGSADRYAQRQLPLTPTPRAGERDIVDLLDEDLDGGSGGWRGMAPTRPMLTVGGAGFLQGSVRARSPLQQSPVQMQTPIQMIRGARSPLREMFMPSTESIPEEQYFPPAEGSEESPLDPEQRQPSPQSPQSQGGRVPPPLPPRRITPPTAIGGADLAGPSTTPTAARPRGSGSVTPPQVRLTTQIPHDYPLHSIYEWFRLNPDLPEDGNFVGPTIGIPRGGGPPVVMTALRRSSSIRSHSTSSGETGESGEGGAILDDDASESSSSRLISNSSNGRR